MNFSERKSIRKDGYDYSSDGLYFITICAQNHQCVFGEIRNRKMLLNPAGEMIDKWYKELINKYPNIKCREYIIMPNHFHCIIEIINFIKTDNVDTEKMDAHVGTSLRGRPHFGNGNIPIQQYGMQNQKYNASIFDMMDWFKTMTTNEYIRGVKNDNWQRFNKRLWQLRYWDYIIRSHNKYLRISQYIIDNPCKWNDDKLNGGHGNMVMEQHAPYGEEEWMV